VTAAGIELWEGEYERRLVSKDPGAAAELPASSGLVVLDTVVTPELTAEGIARDLVRVVQQSRRDAGLDVSDRIRLTIEAPAAVVAAVRAHERFVMAETLAQAVVYGPAPEGSKGTVGEGVEVTVGVAVSAAKGA
jgi:isoleucyl-tRNA synthetase